MSLKDTINNTNTQKDKLKIGKRNIDNKLIELGGEQAIDLKDVPNKMTMMIKKNYEKIAIFNNFSSDADCTRKGDNSYILKKKIDIDFKPEYIFAYMKDISYCIKKGYNTTPGMQTFRGNLTYNSSTQEIILNVEHYQYAGQYLPIETLILFG